MANGAYGANDTPLESTSGAYGANDKLVSDEPQAKSSLLRGIADKGLGFASGAVGATKAIADAAGAGNRVSGALGDANTFINDYLSPEAKADQQEQSAILDAAKGQGAWEGVKAGARAFGVAPVQTAVQGLGSIVPVLAGGLAGLPGAAVTGIAMGAGTAKGAIYDRIKKEGGTEQDAIKAQEYSGANTDQIALSGALGVADALTGVNRIAGGMLRGAVGKPMVQAAQGSERGLLMRTGMGMAGEMPLEAAQGGQEQVAANLAAQRAGYEAGTWDNVASNATLEALASAGPGAAFGALERQSPAKPPAQEVTPPAAAPLQLGNTPDPMISFADGTVGRKSEVEKYISGLPPDQQPAARAKLMGLAPQPSEQVPTPEASQTPVGQLGYNPLAGTPTVFPDGSVALNSEQAFAKRYQNQPATVPRQDGQGQTIIDPSTGPLSAAAAEAVNAGLTESMGTGNALIKSYPTQQDAQAALDARPDADRMQIARHPRATDRFAVMPKSVQDLQAMDAKAATEAAPLTQATGNPQPTTLGTQTNAVAGPGFGVSDVVQKQPQAQAEQAPVATNDVATGTDLVPGGMFMQVGGQNYAVDSFEQASDMRFRARKELERQGGGRIDDAPIMDGAGRVLGYVGMGDSVYATKDADPRSPKLFDAAKAAVNNTPAAPTGAPLGVTSQPVSQPTEPTLEPQAPVTQQTTPQRPEAPPRPPITDAQRQQVIAANAQDLERMFQQDLVTELKRKRGLLPEEKDDELKRSPFKTFLIHHGVSDKPADVVGEGNAFRANNIIPTLFRKNGIGMDELVNRAAEVGFITQDEADNGEGMPKLVEMIRSEVAGTKRHLPLDMQDESVEQQAAQNLRLEVEADAKELGLVFDTGMDTKRLQGMVMRVRDRVKRAPKNGLLKPDRILKNARDAATRIEQKRAQLEAQSKAFSDLNQAEQDAALDIFTDEDGNVQTFMRTVDAQAISEWITANPTQVQQDGTDARATQDVRQDQAPTPRVTAEGASRGQATNPGTQQGSAQGTGASQEIDLFGEAPNASQQAAENLQQEKARKEQASRDKAPTAAEFDLGMEDARNGNDVAPGQTEIGQPAAVSQVTEPPEVTHNGTRLYKTKVKLGGEVVDKWAVESQDNKRKRTAGERTIGGDSLHDTLDAAKKAADFETKQDEQAQARKAAIDAQEKEAQAKKDANKGKSIVERRKQSVLDSPTKFPPQAGLGTGTKRESMQKAVDQERAIVMKMVDDTAAKGRDEHAVDLARSSGYMLGLSNENIPVVKAALEAQARLKANDYKKPSYRVYAGRDTDGSFYEITKTEYDYAQELKEKPAEPLVSKTETSESGDFGPILTQYRHDAQGAIKALTELQNGEAVAALHHPEVGDIDLAWGKPPSGKQEGFGLAKISIKHPEVLDDLQGFLDGLHKDKKNSGANRIRLVNDAGDAVVSLDWKGEQKVWLLTAYKKGAEADTTMDTASNGLKDDTARLEPGPAQTVPQPATESKPAQPAAQEPAAPPVASPDTLRAQADLQAALADLADIFGRNTRLNMMPEQEAKILPVMVKLFDAAFRLGYHKFKDAAKFALDKIRAALGDAVADDITLEHLQGAYISMSSGKTGVDGIRAVSNIEAKTEIESHTAQTDNERNGEPNVSSTNASVERDSPVATTEPAVGDTIQDDATGIASRAGKAGGRTTGSAGRGQQDGAGVPAGGTAAAGERGDQRLPAAGQQSELADIVTGADFREPGGDSGITRVPPESIATSQVDATADRRTPGIKNTIERNKANKTPVVPLDLDNIRATLPQLLPGQQEDVLLAEKRFAKPDGYGMLFTNGTGTGKTFSGLGVVKRHAMQGKTNTLIVVPDTKISADWIESAKLLGLEVTALDDTTTHGKGIVVTTYANLGMNDSLAKRQWDVVVADEAHSLMQAADGEPTSYLHNLRAITYHPDGAGQRHSMLNRDKLERAAELVAEILALEKMVAADSTTAMQRQGWEAKSEKLQAELGELRKELNASQQAIRDEVDAGQGAGRTRLVALSATPFAYEKTIDWANGYLFDYNEGQTSDRNEFRGYNSGSNKDRYMMQHFGYSMRYNKMTRPDANVDSGLMQRQWNANLKKSGALSGRMLDVVPDYDRRFILVESAIGNRIDEALEWISEQRQAEKGHGPFGILSDAINEQFKYLQKRYLLEAIKATEVIPIVKQHMKMGRKVVVFHDYKKGGGFNPFFINSSDDAIKDALGVFNDRFSDLVNYPFSAMRSPIDVFKKELPGVLLINGDEKKADLHKRYKQFQDDASGPLVMLVQSAKNKGWSGHDTTGKHQRVLINLGQPTAPTLAIQQEGRIYRTGQATDAIMRYMNTGTNWERWTFASTIATRASTAENLGMGEMARALKDSFIQSFEESDTYEPGHEGEGKGGKERDKAANDAITEYDRAKTFYFGQQKKNSRTKAQEGVDYFATPEPVGLKMVQWLDARGGESTLEPSAGHGAIARWLPDNTNRTAIEPSFALRSKLALVMEMKETGDRILGETFEDHHVSNKYDGIVMNPPFGTAGKTAVDHIAKAATHLRDGGRLVAILPTGPAADKKFDKWFYEESEKPIKPLMVHPTLGPIYKGDAVSIPGYEQTKFKAFAKKGELLEIRAPGYGTSETMDRITKIEPTGLRTETFKAAEGLSLVANIKLPQVTFERAGTAVATRIVVIEKSAHNAMTRDRDYSDITDIKELFDALENLDFAARTKPVEAAPIEPAKAERPAAAPKPVKVTASAGDEIVINGKKYEIQIFTTQAGKEKRGVWMDSKIEASKYSSRAFTSNAEKDKANKGKWFVDEFWFPKDAEIIKPDAKYSRTTQAPQDSGLGNITTKPQALVEKSIKAILTKEGMTAVAVSGGNSDVLRDIARKFGKQIVFFRQVQDGGPQDGRLGAPAGNAESQAGSTGASQGVSEFITNGFINTSRPDVVFLNTDGSNHLAYILGHELGHTLRIDNPALWVQMAKELQPLVRNWSQYKANSAETFATDDAHAEELFGDVIGEQFLNPEFWSDMASQNKTLFQKIATAAKAMLDKAISLMIGRQSSPYISDMKKARAIIAKTMAQYAFNQQKDQTDTTAFKAWFGDSKVVDKDRKPLVVYHGTTKDFDAFSNGTGWFTADAGEANFWGGVNADGANVMPAYISIKNPRVLQASEASRNKIIDALEALHNDEDGVVVMENGAVRWAVPAETTQIKSAIGNNGNFDSTNPDIRYSRTRIVGETSRQHTPEQLRAMKNVGFQVEVPTLKERAQALWKDAGKKLAQGIADQFAPIKDMDLKAYGLMRLAKGASGAFESLLHGGLLKLSDNVYDFDETKRGGVIDKLLMPLQGEHHDFMRWVAANRAERLLGDGKEHLFSPQDIADLKTLATGQAAFDYTIQNGIRAGRTTRDRAEIYRDSLVTFNAFNKNVLDMAEQSGMIDADSRKVWEHEFYVPFYRVAEDTDGGVRGMNIKGGVVRQQAFKQLKGGKGALNADLLDNTLMNWAHLLDASAKNRAAKATIEAAERLGVAIGGNQATLAQMGTSVNNKNGVVWFMDGGMKRYSLIDNQGDGAYLMTAITALEYAGMRSPIMNAMGFMKNALTIGVTASPFFKIRNLIRDSVQVIGTSGINANPLANVAQGWKLTNPKSDEYFRLLAGGGTIHFGTMLEGSEAKRVQALVESGVDAGTILNNEHKVKAFYRKVIEPGITAYNELGNRGEAVNRASLYAQLVSQGMTHAEASLQARDLMDFSMQGSFTSIRFLSQVVPFFNARIQGMFKLGRAAKEDPARFSAVIGAAAVISLGLLAAYSDDDDWKRRADWDRNNFWWFKFGGVAFRIPKPFEIGAVATLAERGFELAFEKEMTATAFRKQVMTLLGDNLSMNPIPQIVKPIMDVYANKDSFSGTPIESMSMERLKSEYRFNDRTSMAARGLSTAANSVTGLVGVESPSPVQIDHMLRGYFGWLGTFIVGAGDKLARPATGQTEQAAPDYWKTITGGMVADLRDAPSKYVSNMYDQAKVIEQAYGTWRSLVRQGDKEGATEFAVDNRGLLTKYHQVEAIKRTESKLNERIRFIERSDMNPDDKRSQIRRIREQQDLIAKRLAPI